MKKILACAAMLLSLSAFIFDSGAEVGEPAPDFTATDTNGNTVTLSELKGTPVVLEWTNHKCPFVVKYYKADNMQALQEKYTEKGVKWIRVISSAPGKQGHVSDEKANDLAHEQGAKASHTIRDESGKIGKMYDAKTTPHMFVIDEKGTLVYSGAIDSIASPDVDDIAVAKPYVANALDSVLAGEKVETATSQPYGCSVKY